MAHDHSAALADQVRTNCATGTPLRIEGSGSYASYCSPPQSAEVLSTREHHGIVSFDPTEMVVTVRSGTPLLELEAVLAEKGQQLGTECPQLSEQATIGGAIAMGFSGSGRPFRGAMRDFVLGARIINGLGEDLQFGGQVMKNVAGYDLSRLMVGSAGRLAVLLEVSLKLLPLPEESLSLSFQYPDYREAISFADQLVNLAEPLTAASYFREQLFLRFSGRGATMKRLRSSLGGEAFSDSWWQDLRCWRMPWGQATHLGYREHRFREPQCTGNSLVDWNGGLVWSAAPEPTASTQLCLSEPVANSGLSGQLEQRLRRAFDPEAIFRGAGDQ